MSATRHQGSCLCGEVRFEVQGGFEGFFCCHCSRCRKGTGSAHGANLFASEATLSWRAGEAMVRTYAVPGARHVRAFCERCGGALPVVQGRMVVVPAGCLDSPVELRPQAHIFCASGADWEEGLGEAPRFDALPVTP